MKERGASLPWPLVGFSLVLLSIFSDQYFESLQGWAIGEGGPCCWALLRGLGVPRQDLPTGWGLQVPTLRHPLALEHLKRICESVDAQPGWHCRVATRGAAAVGEYVAHQHMYIMFEGRLSKPE